MKLKAEVVKRAKTYLQKGFINPGLSIDRRRFSIFNGAFLLVQSE